jgi:HrpA-like RNA helicase
VEEKIYFLQLCEDRILAKLQIGHGFTVLTGITGSGKTTMVPWALMRKTSIADGIIPITVPKRIAVARLYKTMKKELVRMEGDPLKIAYSMRGSRDRHREEKLVFVTTGNFLNCILLRFK